tara:strand:- start:5809 stop:6219 length:411 start_codon:yes stop_codon:yes gene_type:complete
MSVFALTDASLVINSVDLSDHVRSVTLSITSEELDTTAMSSTGFRTRAGGLKDGSLAIEFNADFASSEIDATFNGIIGTVVTFVVKPTSGSVSATNPSYSGSVLITEYSPLANGVGDLATLSVTFPTSGAILRAVS